MTQEPDSATSPLRRGIYALVLVLFAFIQRPGLLVADTKFDLVVDPGRFLSRAASMWDGGAAFGQIQNQAYGYFFPMGPFFWIGEQLGLEPWVTQRLWWSLLLCLAFFGVLKVAETLGVGKPWTRVVAAFAYALGVHITTIIGASSVEAWPTALVPWVLWAVMRGTDGGSERRWAAVAGLLTVACGGVNAVAVAVVLPLGACWILTRAGGTRRWVFFGWWVGCTLLATLWWLVPLFLMGSYSFPFLDYIENATVTTLPTDLPDVIGGSSVWVPYVDADTYGAGHSLGMTPFLIVDAALLAGLGIAGLARRDMPHRQFLLVSLLVGLALVSFGYTGDGSGWAAATRQDLLDGALAPLRNLHKFDAVLRLPLVLGLAHALAVMMPSWSRATWSIRMWSGVAVLALVGIASPWFIPSVAPAGATEEIPDYWVQAARYLNDQDGPVGGHGRTLVVPAAAFGTYEWGSPRDDVLQPLMTSAWGVRNVVPLAEPGNVAFLDAVTERLESGRPSARLARVLRANGVDRLVVRNDLNRGVSGAPDPMILHQALDQSPGLRAVADFGPMLGWGPSVELDGGRMVPDGGLSGSYAAVEIYEVDDPVGAVSVLPAQDVTAVAGGAGAALDSALVPAMFVLAADDADHEAGEFVLTDTLRRREKAFAAVRRNESSTMAADQDWHMSGREHFHRMTPDQEAWMSTTVWDGVRRVTASSSQAWADAVPPVDRGSAPGAALDGDPDTAWASARGRSGTGQWWQVEFDAATDLGDVTFTMPEDTFVTRVRLSNGTAHVDVDVEDAGEPQTVATGLGPSSSLRISALEVANGAELRGFSLAEVEVPGVSAQRYLQMPEVPSGTEVSGVSLNRDPDTSACFESSRSMVCQDFWVTHGEDGDVIARRFTMPTSAGRAVSLEGSLRSDKAAVDELTSLLPFEITSSSSSSADVRGSVLATLTDDHSTWVADPEDEDPTIRVVWPEKRRVSRIELSTDDAAPGARPTKVVVTAGGHEREVELDAQGRGKFPAVSTRRLVVDVVETAPVFAGVIDPAARMPVAVTQLAVKGSAGGADLLDVAERPLRLPCGEGPAVDVNGRAVETRVRATLAGLLKGSVSIAPCTASVSLRAGENVVLTHPTDAFRLDHVDLFTPGSGPDAQVAAEPVSVKKWSDDRRTLQLAPDQGRRLLVVAENFNPGWEARLDGEVLQPQRVGGWKQGWWVPEDSAGTVQLTFTPQRWFVAGLAAGAVALLVLLGLALVPRRRSARPAASRESTRPLAWLALFPAAGLLAGWPGLAIAVVVTAVVEVGVRRLPRLVDPVGVSTTSAALLVAAGLWTAWDRHRTETLAESWVGQLLVLAALVVAVVGAGLNGPESLKRSIGRSTR